MTKNTFLWNISKFWNISDWAGAGNDQVETFRLKYFKIFFLQIFILFISFNKTTPLPWCLQTDRSRQKLHRAANWHFQGLRARFRALATTTPCWVWFKFQCHISRGSSNSRQNDGKQTRLWITIGKLRLMSFFFFLVLDWFLSFSSFFTGMSKFDWNS